MIPIDFSVLIQAITGIANPTAILRNKLERNETVIRLLKQFNLSPDSPPADFSGVYAYTLIEYGVGKPKAMLELFRQPEIRQALQAAWGQDNFSVLLQVGEGFLEGAALGHELRTLGIDVRQEFYQFATVFIAIAKRTRTPADILTTQQLNSLHRQIAQVQDRLERLPSIEGIRTEMARLTAQSPLALPEASVSEQCRAFALAQQMRGWFETLDYRFEPYEQWQVDGFEWIINIPVRRGRYDRILVRGIEGEAELRDVMALRQSVEAQQADEGWLVTSRRISRAARDEVEKPENRHLDCYTFDELVDLDADFTGYIEWLEAEIKRRKIDTRYVPLGCTKEEIDLDTQQRLGVSRYDERDGWIDGYLDRWLDDPAKEHISVLGEFGTGKTWVAFHYAWTALQRYQEAKERGVQRPRLPLVITLRDYAKALNVENVLAGFFFTQHNIRLNSEVFDQLNRMGKLLLIFDGFDEMAAKVDKQQMINNFWELAKVVVPGAKVILTCRTEHFPDAREGRALLNAQLQASTSNLTGETPQFEVLELEKFNDEQIRQVMSFQASMPTVEQVISNPQLLDLARRPVMTELILEALPEIEAGKPVDMSRVYLYAVRRKMERDIKAERTFTSLADKLYFLCELSWEMLSSDRMSLNYREFPDRIRRLFGSAVQEEKDLDHWHYDMMGQTMLIRNAEGDYTPAHRSLLEFFVAYKFASELGALAPDFLELAQRRTDTDLLPDVRKHKWSEYFEQGNSISLTKFVSETTKNLQISFGKFPLSKAVLDLLQFMLMDNSCDYLLSQLDALRTERGREVSYIEGNIINLLLAVDPLSLAGQNLSHMMISGANFVKAILQNTNFSHSSFRECLFSSEIGRTHSIKFSSNNDFFASGESNGDIRLWRASDTQQVLRLRGHKDWVRGLLFSADSNILYSSSDDRTVKIWDLNTGRCIQTLEGHEGRVYSLQMTSDQSTLISVGNDRTIRMWNILTGECFRVLSDHSRSVNSVDLAHGDTSFITGSDDKSIKIWEIDSGLCIRTLEGHTDEVISAIYLDKWDMIASSSYDRTIKFWNIVTGKCLKTLPVNKAVICLCYSQADDYLIGGTSSDVIMWDMSNFECVGTIPSSVSTFNSVSLTSDGETLALANYDSGLSLWNLRTKSHLKHLDGTLVPAYTVAMTRENRRLVSCMNEKIVVWDFETGQFLNIMTGHDDVVWEIDISPCGNLLVSTSADKTARIWNLETGQCLFVLKGHINRIYSVSFSPNGNVVATASADGSVRLWSAHNGDCLQILQGHTDKVWEVRFSSDGALISSGSRDQTVRVWDAHTGECIRTIESHEGDINCLAFSKEGSLLASAGHDAIIRLWDLNSGECISALEGHTSRINSLVFDPDQRFLISGSSDSVVKVWDTDTQFCVKEFSGYGSPVWAISLSADSKLIAVGTLDSTIRIWHMEDGDCRKSFSLKRIYQNMDITGVQGLTEGEQATLKALGAIDNQP